jgi:hypothetical protein
VTHELLRRKEESVYEENALAGGGRDEKAWGGGEGDHQ